MELHRNGTYHDDNGFDVNGLHRNGTYYDDEGYDINGLDKNGYID